MTIERNEKLEDSLLEKMSSVDLKKLITGIRQ